MKILKIKINMMKMKDDEQKKSKWKLRHKIYKFIKIIFL